VEHEQDEAGSVFDFVYVDRIRLGSLLAQLDNDGVVSTTKRVGSTATSRSGALKVGVIPVLSVDGSVHDVGAESFERSFDASMALPINAITVLQEAGLLRRTLLPSEGDEGLVPLGGLVHLEGHVAIRDIDLIHRLWQPITQAVVADVPKAQQAAKKKEAEFAWKILKELPPTVQFTMLTNEHLFLWGLLNANDPTLSTHEIGLKHGSSLQGKWHLIGILDAYPEHDDHVPFDLGGGGDILDSLGPIIDQFRVLMGRPKRSFGITPLAIFRPVNDYTQIVAGVDDDAEPTGDSEA
jgi:hypothetical protein